MGTFEIDWVVLGLAILAGLKVVVTMKEQIKTLFNKLAEKESDIQSLKDSIKELHGKISNLKDAYQEGNTNIVNLINANHITFIEKLAEIKK